MQTRADERESVGAQVEPAYLPRRPSPPLPSFSPSSLSSSPSPPFLLNPSLQAPPLNTPPLSALLSRPSPLLCPLSSPPLLSHGRSQADILALHPNSLSPTRLPCHTALTSRMRGMRSQFNFELELWTQAGHGTL